MRLLFSRHGESDANLQRILSNRDMPHRLTQMGIAQSKALAASLADWNMQKIIASPIPRAQETAAIIADRLGLTLSTSPALREFDCGILEGRGDDEAWASHHALIHAWDTEQAYARRIPGGESFNDIKARFLPFVSNTIAECEDLPGDILLISHGSMLHQMLPLLFANIDRAFTAAHPLENCGLVVGHSSDGQFVCSVWAGIDLL